MIVPKSGHIKPVGLDGSLTHSLGPGIDERTFNRHVAPKAKDMIEADIAASFARLVTNDEAGAVQLEKLPENDLDFGWSQGTRHAKIELTELTLASPPYQEKGQSAIIQYKLWSEKLFDLVKRRMINYIKVKYL